MVSAMERDVPSQAEIAPSSLLISAGAAFMSARKPDMAFFPTSACAADACSDSDKPEKAVRQSSKISFRSRMEPSALVVCTVTSPIASPQNFTSPDKAVRMERREVPACVDLMPAFAIKPIACAVSSTENPSAPATGAAYLKVSPIMDTLVLALELAAANTSAK